MIKSKVEFMNGGRVSGYHYICIEGTDFVVCEDGHPDFALRFDENKKGENKARRYNVKMNRQLRNIQVNKDTPAEDQHSKDVKPELKPLAQYLAEYLDNMETAGGYGVTGDVGDLEDTIEKALGAYESTENVRINFIKMKEKA